ncbi:unnamed protein product [Cyprideis torosa]|uniref:Uncharacterized protein n=1 Tax=Cyprideis torosa TaxID=163714 RepID=A0A7R8ZT53_9CRUS|nr:unnamed protein product [Cyprideis torosa]CAG0907061.1 unnamed protein product [Cyprideis torosa]
MHSLLFGFFLALALVDTIDGVLDLPSNDPPKIPVKEAPNPAPLELTCPEGFFSLGNSCYAVFDNYTTDRLSWNNAQAFCGSLGAGGHLLELEAAEEITRLKNHLLESGYVCGVYWIGGEEVGDTNTFVWASTGQVIGDSDWAPGMPNGSGSGDAIILSCSINWQWLDTPKSYDRRFICEAPPIAV